MHGDNKWMGTVYSRINIPKPIYVYQLVYGYTLYLPYCFVARSARGARRACTSNVYEVAIHNVPKIQLFISQYTDLAVHLHVTFT